MLHSVRDNGFGVNPWLLVLMVAFGPLQEFAYAVDNGKAPARREQITKVVIHAIGGPTCKNNRVVFTEAPGDAKRWKNWFEGQRNLSIHYVVDRNGNVEKSIDEDRIAWHARGHNGSSIGIELVNKGDGVEEYPKKQVLALTELVKSIKRRHRAITVESVVRHSDIDDRTFDCGGRKVDLKQDPGPKFPYDDFISNLSPKPLFPMFQ